MHFVAVRLVEYRGSLNNGKICEFVNGSLTPLAPPTHALIFAVLNFTFRISVQRYTMKVKNDAECGFVKLVAVRRRPVAVVVVVVVVAVNE